jgi:hypothetical protein
LQLGDEGKRIGDMGIRHVPEADDPPGRRLGGMPMRITGGIIIR